MIFPDLGLRRVELHVAGASVREPGKTEAGRRVRDEMTLADEECRHWPRFGFAVVGRDRAERDWLAYLDGAPFFALEFQLRWLIADAVGGEASLSSSPEIGHHHRLIDSIRRPQRRVGLFRDPMARQRPNDLFAPEIRGD